MDLHPFAAHHTMVNRTITSFMSHHNVINISAHIHKHIVLVQSGISINDYRERNLFFLQPHLPPGPWLPKSTSRPDLFMCCWNETSVHANTPVFMNTPPQAAAALTCVKVTDSSRCSLIKS